MAPFLRNKPSQQGQEEEQPNFIDDLQDEEFPEEEEDKRPVIKEPQLQYDMSRQYEPDDQEDSEQQQVDMSRLQIQRRKMMSKKYSQKIRPKMGDRMLTPRFAPTNLEQMNQEERFGIYKNVLSTFLYHPDVKLPSLADFVQKYIEIKIEAQYLSKFNLAYLERRIYGTDVYTSDSDPVCALHHAGVIYLDERIPTNCAGISAFFRVSKSRNTYPQSTRNGLKSRKRTQYEGHSLKPECVKFLDSLGTLEELSHLAAKMPTPLKHPKRKKPINLKTRKMYEVQNRLTYDLSNDPAFVYSFQELLFRENFSPAKLFEKLLGHVMFLETEDTRYELSVDKSTIGQRELQKILNSAGEKDELTVVNEVKAHLDEWSLNLKKVLNPRKKDIEWLRNQEIPLVGSSVEMLVEDFKWGQLQWWMEGVDILGDDKKIEISPIKLYKYFPRRDLLN